MNTTALNGAPLNGAGIFAVPAAPTDTVLSAFRTLYAATPALTAILPTFAVGTVPPGTPLPWGIVTKIHNRSVQASGNTQVEITLVQISMFAASEDELAEIATAIRAMFPVTVSLPIAGGRVMGVYIADDRVIGEKPATTAEAYTFGNHQTYRVLVSRPN